MTTNKKLWFRAKTFGWGWTPISWQGWVLTLIYTVALVGFVVQIDPQVNSASDFLMKFGVWFVILTVPFLVICWIKGERLGGWRWGRRR